jgi:hypothetical protein
MIKKDDYRMSIIELDHAENVSLEQVIKLTIDWMKEYYKL